MTSFEDTPQPQRRPPLPATIPQGARIVVRTDAGIDERTGRRTYRDFLGHGRRPAAQVTIDASVIVRLKPIPERRVHRS